MSAPITADQIIQRIASRTGLKPGFADAERRAATPYVVVWSGLTREDLGDALFEERLCSARKWCEEQCPDGYEIEPIRNQGRLVGRQFRFASDNDAALFKLWFL